MEPLRGDTRRPVNMIKPTKEREIDPYLGCIRTMSDKGRLLLFWERRGTNSTWDPFGFCHGKRGG
jgi:hypothetical protein